MRIDIVTLFPELCDGFLSTSILGRARAKNLFEAHCHQIRDYTKNKQRQTDDYPYGGGCGMVLYAQPIADCLRAVADQCAQQGRAKPHVVFLTAAGQPYNEETARRLSSYESLALVCGHYEGIDQRVIDTFGDEEISIGDYVLTGGELGALVLVDCIGQKVDWRQLLTGTAVTFNPNGTAQVDPVTYQTAEPDIFAGGDAVTGQKFAIDAIAAGKEGAISLHRFVQKATLTIGRNRRQFVELDKENALIPVGFDNTPRQQIGYNEALRRTFRDERIAFTAQQVQKETARCLSCGASVVDPNKCIGCGVCTTKCAFDAIHLHRERPECSTMIPAEDKMKAILPYMVKREIKIRKAGKK